VSLSRILDVPSQLVPVPRELLEELAATLKPAARTLPASSFTGRSTFHIEAFLARHLNARPPVGRAGTTRPRILYRKSDIEAYLRRQTVPEGRAPKPPLFSARRWWEAL
jgi:hypothetical protein